jgi:hypothetical protein
VKRAGTGASSRDDLAGSWLKFRVSYAPYTSSLEFAGLLKVQAHCPRAEGLTPRSFYRVNNPG